jgi:hypothetical protein
MAGAGTVLIEEYCWLVAGGWFVLREKYCWLVADKPSEQARRQKDLCCTRSDELSNFISLVNIRIKLYKGQVIIIYNFELKK